jgi:uncharacterized protein (DUF2062 family)
MPLRRIVQKAKGFLSQGLQPRELAASIAIGVLIGVFPIYGTTTFVLVFLAWRLSLNLPLMLFVSYLLTPMQLLLIIPLMRVGEWIFGFPYLELDLNALALAFQGGFLEASAVFSGRLMLSVFGWVLVAAPFSLLLFLVLFQFFRFFHRQARSRQAPD